MKFVITLGDAVELACFALALAGLAIGVAVNWARERRPVRPHEAANRPPRGQVADHLRADGTTVGKLVKSAVPEKERQIHDARIRVDVEKGLHGRRTPVANPEKGKRLMAIVNDGEESGGADHG
jgi:hypothetical protein